ncbi:hypothetical protein AB2N04_19310 [Nitratireductor sp. GISD-1A_MAKvit]|uniref:hypothetical protein n=1 Tax=Nitratireductor sp. GISD-1A_MAKvit TaxID=3234198 RepID=UPI003467A4F4
MACLSPAVTGSALSIAPRTETSRFSASSEASLKTSAEAVRARAARPISGYREVAPDHFVAYSDADHD